jgi:hypothetical protein
MLTSDTAKMLGHLCPNNGFAWTSARGVVQARPWSTLETRKAKRDEQRLAAREIDEELAWFADNELADSFDLPRSSTYVDLDEYVLDAATDRWFDWWDDEDRDPFPFDDFGDRDRAQRSLQAAHDRSDVLALADDPDMPGWGTALTFDDLHNYRLSARPF